MFDLASKRCVTKLVGMNDMDARICTYPDGVIVVSLNA